MFENIDLSVNLPKGKLLNVSIIYRPPHTNIVNFLLEFDEYLLSLTNALPYNSSLLISGDFKINLLKVDNNSKVAEFTDLIYLNSLLPLTCNLTSFTNHSATLINNIFAS